MGCGGVFTILLIGLLSLIVIAPSMTVDSTIDNIRRGVEDVITPPTPTPEALIDGQQPEDYEDDLNQDILDIDERITEKNELLAKLNDQLRSVTGDASELESEISDIQRQLFILNTQRSGLIIARDFITAENERLAGQVSEGVAANAELRIQQAEVNQENYAATLRLDWSDALSLYRDAGKLSETLKIGNEQYLVAGMTFDSDNPAYSQLLVDAFASTVPFSNYFEGETTIHVVDITKDLGSGEDIFIHDGEEFAWNGYIYEVIIESDGRNPNQYYINVVGEVDSDKRPTVSEKDEARFALLDYTDQQLYIRGPQDMNPEMGVVTQGSENTIGFLQLKQN